jgi:hypothetical protein
VTCRSQVIRITASPSVFFIGKKCTRLHEEIISKLDQVGEMFRVLLIKTNMRMPYTSISFELGCGYWDAKSEKRLRAATRSRSQPSNATKLKRR